MSKTKRMRQLVMLNLVTFLVGSFWASFAHAGSDIKLTKGETVYVPIYSNIYVGDRELAFNLSANLSIRNTDLEHTITISSVDYYDSDGKLVKNYLGKPMKLKSMSSTHFFLKTSDTSGGAGANFIVRWSSEYKVNEPIIESVMSGTRGAHTVSFISRGKAIKDRSE